ncbi:MAG: class I SAM-dependent methyltransferase [Acidimicrobiales bacterium]
MNDEIGKFYDRHPYPPPVTDLDYYAQAWSDGTRRRVDHHLLWPTRPFRDELDILVAGCGTSQAVKYALRYPLSRVVGIDVSRASLEHSRGLAERYDVDNLTLTRLELEQVGELGREFDYIVCTGVLHHLRDPVQGLAALGGVLAPDGALNAMVYARYGRTGVYMIQEYCRLLGIGTAPEELRDLMETLKEMPLGHPLRTLLGSSPEFSDGDALADALLNPRDRAYSVPEVFDLMAGGGLSFGRWLRQAPYTPSCGLIASVPHADLVSGLGLRDQYTAVELFRGTMTRHSFLAYQTAGHQHLEPFSEPQAAGYVPIRPETVIAVYERLPPGASAALLNQAHEFSDLVMFVDEAEKRVFEAIDGVRPLRALPGGDVDVGVFVRRLFDHDLVVIDASR